MSGSEQSTSVELETFRRVEGRPVLARPNGDVYVCKGFEIRRTGDDGASWTRVGALPRSRLRQLAERSRLACRLLRHEVRALARLSDGTYVAANRAGLYRGREGDRFFRPCQVAHGELRLMPPMRVTVGPDDVVIWGEYGSTRPLRDVRLFASHDRGDSFAPFLTFDAGTVGHIHNIVWDEKFAHYWVLAGDHDHEPGIGRLSSDLERFEWFHRGEQQYRAIEIFDLGDRLLYATDSEVAPNGLISLDKSSGRAERLREFEGSCIYACRFGDLFAITTTVEPSPVNNSRSASLWLSRDGEHWKCALRCEKDRWNGTYFQFGSLVLPTGSSNSEAIFVSGQAVEDLDGSCIVARVSTGAEW